MVYSITHETSHRHQMAGMNADADEEDDGDAGSGVDHHKIL